VKTPLLALVAGLLSLRATAVQAQQSDWRATLTATPPNFLPPLRAVETEYRFGWERIVAAEGTLKFSTPQPSLRRMDLKGGTTGFVKNLWPMDARGFSIVDATTLRPVRVRQAEWLRRGASLVAQEFTPLDVLRSKGGSIQENPAPAFFEDKPIDATQMAVLTHAKAKLVKFPALYDLHSAFLFVRGQPLAQGDAIRLVIFQDNWPYLATLRVAGREQITVAAGTYPAIKLNLSLQYVNKQFKLEPHTKFKRAVGWLSDDADRLILKIQADVFVGSVWTELQHARF